MANGLDQLAAIAKQHDIERDELVAFAFEAVVDAGARCDLVACVGAPPVGDFARAVNPGAEFEVADQDVVRVLQELGGIV